MNSSRPRMLNNRKKHTISGEAHLFRSLNIPSLSLFLSPSIFYSNSWPSTRPGGFLRSPPSATHTSTAWTASAGVCTPPRPSPATSPPWRRGWPDGRGGGVGGGRPVYNPRPFQTRPFISNLPSLVEEGLEEDASKR